MEATIGNGFIIQIDDEDSHLLEDHKWRAYKNRNTTVITARLTKEGKDERLSLPRLITQAKPGQWVWHLNGDPLDVRRHNLKIMHRPTGRKLGSMTERCKE